MFGKQITAFRLLGFRVKVDLTWVFLTVLVTWSLAEGFFPAYFEGLATATYWWMAVAGAIGLFFSLIFHELSHALVARHFGLPIGGITLFLFGGVAEMEEEPATPKVELLMAIAGPVASLILALLSYAAAIAGQAVGLPVPVLAVALYLAFINGLLAVFNLLPAFPLDGGRIFRALLWHWKRDLHWATRVASRVGTVFAFVLMGFGLVEIVGGNFIGGVWWFVIGLFLRGAAMSSYYQLVTRRTLRGDTVRTYMTAQPISVPPELTVRELVEDFVYRYHHDMFPVVHGKRLLGCVSTRQVKELPRDRWGLASVSSIAVPSTPSNTVDAGDDAMAALSLMQRTGESRLMVTSAGELVGIIALKDILSVLALKIDLDQVA